MSGYQEDNYKLYQKTKTQFEETEQASKPDMIGMLKLLSHEFKTTMINMLRDLMHKIDSMQEQMSNVSRETEILRAKQK